MADKVVITQELLDQTYEKRKKMIEFAAKCKKNVARCIGLSDNPYYFRVTVEELENYCHLRCQGCQKWFVRGELVYVWKIGGRSFVYCHDRKEGMFR